MTGEDTRQVNARLVRANEGENGRTGSGQTEHAVGRQLLQEHHMEIYVNEKLAARLVCTANDLEDLVVGRLITEGLIDRFSDIEQMHLCESGNRARVFLKETVEFAPKEEEEPTCCTENHVYLRRLSSEEEKPLATEEKESGPCGSNVAKLTCRATWKDEWIFGLVNAFAQDSKLHKSTGGTHSCMLAVEDRILYQAEDIGRHNALDKAVGYAVRNQLDRQKCILFTTGRVPTDMLKKVIQAGIPILVSKAIPTADAVELAKANGVALICRAWPDSFEVYA